MNPSIERADAGAEPPRVVPRFFSCLIKGPLGCLFFALGAALILVLLLPPALGRVLDRTLERWFEERHAGRLELSDVWLGSLYGPQRIERVILRDPDGDEVLRGELHAPSLAELFDRSHRFGPIELRIELLHLVEGEDGRTNLERALEELPRGSGFPERGGLSTDVPFEFKLEVVVARLRVSNAAGTEVVLEGLEFEGKLDWAPDALHLALEGGTDPDIDGALRAQVELDRPEFGSRRPPGAWKSALVLEGVPTALAHTLCAPARPFATLAGERTDRLSWSRDGQDVALLLEDEGGRFELLGENQGGVVSGPPGSTLTAALPCANGPGRALVVALLPLVSALECADPDASHELRLTDFRWPLDGDWSALAGELELVLAPSNAEFASWHPELGTGASLASLPGPLHVGVRGGILQYARFELPLEEGGLRIDGTLELASGLGDFIVSGARDGIVIGPLRITGTRDALVPGAAEPPALPDVPEPGHAEPGMPEPPRED